MSEYYICCEKCLETIAKESTSAAKLWMDLCNLRMKRGSRVVLRGQDSHELRILELGKFIITSDLPDHVAIHIIGHLETVTGEDFFCAKEGNHD